MCIDKGDLEGFCSCSISIKVCFCRGFGSSHEGHHETFQTRHVSFFSPNHVLSLLLEPLPFVVPLLIWRVVRSIWRSRTMDSAGISVHQGHCHPQHGRAGAASAAVHCFAMIFGYRII